MKAVFQHLFRTFILLALFSAWGCGSDDSSVPALSSDAETGDTGSGPGGNPADDSVSVQLIAAASEKIHETDPAAFVIWAGGRDGAGADLNLPSETNVWDFVAVKVLATEPGQVWWLTYSDATWHVNEYPNWPFGIEFTDMAVITMDVQEAWTKVLDAGFSGPFRTWELFKTLNASVPNPGFVFTMPSGQFIIVDSITGEVSIEASRTEDTDLRDAWECFDNCRNAHYSCMDSCRENFPGSPDCYDLCDEARTSCDASCEGDWE